MNHSPDVFDRRLLRLRRDRMASAIEGHDFLLERVADDLVERLAAVRRSFPVVLSLGAHHGLLGRRMAGLPGVETVVEMDASAAMLGRCSGLKVRADEELLPLRDASVDLVVSGLALQFVNDLPGTLVQVRRLLRPDGLLLASMPGGATLHELRTALLIAEEEVEGGASPRIAPFADVRDLGSLLQRARFAMPVVDSETVVVTYADPLALMRELRAMGAGNVMRARRRTPMRRRTLVRTMEIYAERFGMAGGRVPATFEILTLTGWAPHPSQQQPLQPGSARTRLADVLGTKEQSTGEAANPGAHPGRKPR